MRHYIDLLWFRPPSPVDRARWGARFAFRYSVQANGTSRDTIAMLAEFRRDVDAGLALIAANPQIRDSSAIHPGKLVFHP